MPSSRTTAVLMKACGENPVPAETKGKTPMGFVLGAEYLYQKAFPFQIHFTYIGIFVSFVINR